MFDFRYHIASLTAVFVALVIGILVGVGISGTGFVRESERDNLNRVIDDLRAQRDAARAELDVARENAAAAEAFVEEAYPLVIDRRLAGMNIAVVSIGPLPAELAESVETLIDDADGVLLRTAVLTMPPEMSTITAALRARPELRDDADDWAANGRRLGRELVFGQEEMLGALAPVLVEERSGGLAEPADAVVVVGPSPGEGETRRAEFLRGLYTGLAGGVPAVALEARAVEPSMVADLAEFGFSTVDNGDTEIGRVAAAALLATPGSRGRYGVKDTAEDGPLPPLEPVPVEPGPGG